jgi:DNA mismatch repair protein MutL
VAIRRLPENLVNRIAAGEVIERPANAVKELVENAVDAGARSIEIALERGGRTRIVVADDGEGIPAAELTLAVERHATSKLASDDLLRIVTLGFRGEALPAIGAVSRLRLTSRSRDAREASQLAVEFGAVGPIMPAALAQGTRVEVRDLFAATPARLKFLKSERWEAQLAADAVKRLALAHPDIAFSLADDGRIALKLARYPDTNPASRLARCAEILGRDFAENALALDAAREGVRLFGFIGLPTFNRANALQQYFAVSGRPVRDKLLLASLRAAYADVLPHDRHAVAALELALAQEQVDVNVHPTKTEVRFREPQTVRGLIIGAVRHALAQAGHRAAASSNVARALRPAPARPTKGGHYGPAPYAPGLAEEALAYQAPLAPFEATGEFVPPKFAPASPVAPADRPADLPSDHPLGVARGQVHATYIVAQTGDGVVLVDQHAAHERIVYERLKAQAASGALKAQALLLPEVVELDGALAERLLAEAGELARFGLSVEAFGQGAVLVREVPAILKACDLKKLIRDLADELKADENCALEERLNHVLATVACHGSVRAGQTLGIEEMNALLRDMEQTPMTGQCNHGRPTHIELKLSDIERLFKRR